MAKIYGIAPLELRPGIQGEGFEMFFKNDYAPLGLRPGWLGHMLKADRGVRAGKYMAGIVLMLLTSCQQAAPATSPAPTTAPVAPTAVPTGAVPATATVQDSFAVPCAKECEWTIKVALGTIDPTDLAIDRQGNLIVLNNATARIMTFDSDGRLLSQWGKSGSKDGETNTPIAVALDSLGSIYISDLMIRSRVDNAVVAKFDADGKYLKTFSAKDPFTPGFVSGIAVDAEDNVYAAMAWSDRVDKFDSTGKYITTLGRSGSGDGQFKKPNGLVVDSSGMLYVADTDNNRISKLDSNGKFLSKITNCGSDTSVKFFPVDIALDATGNIYVTDVGSAGVCKYDSDGKFMSRWGSAGSGDGQFYRAGPSNDVPSPWGIAVDKQGNIFVSDYGNHRIVKFKPR